MDLECLGCIDAIGIDYGAILQTAGGLAQGGIAAYELDQASQKLQANEQKALDASIAADITSATAAARADVSAQLKSKSTGIDKAAAAAASAAADVAGAQLTAAAADKRAAAADKGLAEAEKNSKAKPSDGYLVALAKAWQTVANKAHNKNIATEGDKDKSENWLTKRVIGPIPGYGVLGIGVVVLGGIVYVIKRMVT